MKRNIAAEDDKGSWRTIEETGPRSSATSTARASYGEASRNTEPVPSKTVKPSAAAPPNRFGIKPGPRWDGVARTNGFEDQLYVMRSSKQREEDDRYRASVSDW